MIDGPYRYLPTEEEFRKHDMRRAKATLKWLRKFKIEPPILEWSKRTPLTEMLEKEFGEIENITINEPDNDYVKPKVHSYQTIFCFDVLEHMMNPFFVVKRIHGALKTGGHLFITCPAAIPWPFSKGKHNFHEFRKDEIQNLLLRAGYRAEIKTRRGTAMVASFGIRPYLRLFFRKRYFIHATPDWRKKEHWWDLE